MAGEVFCTPADVKAFTPIQAGWNEFDTRIAGQIQAATAQMRTFCRREFTLSEYIQYAMAADTLNGGTFRVHVKEPPIAAETLFIDYDATGRFIENSDQLVSLVDDTDFIVDYGAGTIEFISPMSYSQRGLRIIYDGGYSVANETPPRVQVPAQLVTGCAMQSAFLMQRIAGSQLGQESSEDKGDTAKFNVDPVSGLISEVRSICAQFRRPLVGRR